MAARLAISGDPEPEGPIPEELGTDPDSEDTALPLCVATEPVDWEVSTEPVRVASGTLLLELAPEDPAPFS